MSKLEDLREMLSEELEKFSRKKDIDQNDLCNIKNLSASIHYIDKVMLADEMIDEYGYSNARAGRDGDGDGRYSERRGRDARGRYTSRDSYNRSYENGGNSRGYSGHYEEHILNKMRDVIEDAEREMRH